MLTQKLKNALAPWFTDDQRIEQFATELTHCYSEPHRHYHTLAHIASLLEQREQHAAHFTQLHEVDLAILYHDVIYDPSRTDNEAASAELAKMRLREAGVPEKSIEHISDLILSTQTHDAQSIPDAALLLDLDLSVLGASPEVYAAYAKQIRQEYSMYPDALYGVGRAKVLTHFLERPRIYQTALYFDLYEYQARGNLRGELEALGK